MSINPRVALATLAAVLAASLAGAARKGRAGHKPTQRAA